MIRPVWGARESTDPGTIPKCEVAMGRTRRKKSVKIGAKVVSHGRDVTFHRAEVAVARELLRKISSLIDDPRPRPAPASAEEIDGEAEMTGEVCLDDRKYGQMAFRKQEYRKISSSDGRGGKTIPTAARCGCHRHEIGDNLGTVG